MNPFGEAASLLIAIDEEQRSGFGIERDFKRSVGVNHGLEGEGESMKGLWPPGAGHQCRRRRIGRPVEHQSAGNSLLAIPGAVELDFDRFF